MNLSDMDLDRKLDTPSHLAKCDVPHGDNLTLNISFYQYLSGVDDAAHSLPTLKSHVLIRKDSCLLSTTPRVKTDRYNAQDQMG